jgi:hypothetical protein
VVTASGATTFCQGGSVILSTTSPGSLQWLKNGLPVTGATGSSITVTESGNYSVSTEINYCSATSASTQVNVTTSGITPLITASGSTSICQGGSVVLSTSSTGILQWLKDGVIIAGATAQTYTATQAGSYSLRTGVSPCTAVSLPVVISITALPATPIVTLSGPASFCQGGNVILSTITTGPLQWIKDGSDIAGATGQSHTATQAGNYSVRAGTAQCISTSTIIAITVSPLPAIPVVTASGSTTVCQGGNVLLSTTTGGTLQWLKDGNVITGATGQSYAVTQAGNYAVQAGSLSCAVTSAITTVAITALPATPVITASGTTTICQGQSISLTSSAASANQWYKDGTVITGANGQSYTVNQQGNYSVITTANNCASLPSSPTAIVVNPLPAKPVISVNVNTMTSSASSGNQWYLNGAAITGATGQQYDGTVSGQYSVSATINGCSMASDVFNFTFIPNPDLITLSDVAVYPNPVKDNLVIANKANRKLEIRIFNVQGVLIYSGNIFSLTGTVEMKNMRPGTYAIEIIDTVTSQFVVKKIVKL